MFVYWRVCRLVILFVSVFACLRVHMSLCFLCKGVCGCLFVCVRACLCVCVLVCSCAFVRLGNYLLV